MLQFNKMSIQAAQCPVCRDVIVSRWQHDLHECGCGEIAIDGGQEYLKLLWNEPNRPIHVTVVVDSIEEVRASPGVWGAQSTEPRRYLLLGERLVPG
jgi:hypothetical protein